MCTKFLQFQNYSRMFQCLTSYLTISGAPIDDLNYLTVAFCAYSMSRKVRKRFSPTLDQNF